MFWFFKKKEEDYEVGDKIIFAKDVVVEDIDRRKIKIPRGVPGQITGKNVMQSMISIRNTDNVEITYDRYHKIVLQDYKDKIKKINK